MDDGYDFEDGDQAAETQVAEKHEEEEEDWDNYEDDGPKEQVSAPPDAGSAPPSPQGGGTQPLPQAGAAAPPDADEDASGTASAVEAQRATGNLDDTALPQRRGDGQDEAVAEGTQPVADAAPPQTPSHPEVASQPPVAAVPAPPAAPPAPPAAAGGASGPLASDDAPAPEPRHDLPAEASPQRAAPQGTSQRAPLASSASAPSAALPKAKKAPERKRALDVCQAYTHSVDMPPAFSMRAKIADPADKEVRPTATAYTLGNCGRKGPMGAPSWSMAPRRPTMPSHVSREPGPGEYAQPSTLYGSHPQLPVPGRVPKSTTKRSSPADALTMGGATPAPHDYKVTAPGEFGSVAQSKAPKYSMRAKISDPADKEVRPTATAYSLGNQSRTGTMSTPHWTMAPRKTGEMKIPDQPGPGEYAQPSTLYGSHPQLPVPGRVPKSTTKRSSPADALTMGGATPAPHDYKVTAPGEFGSVAQSKAPKYSMRAKISDPADKEVRPGATSYSVGKLSRHGPLSAPSWSMAPRDTIAQKVPMQPGPGEYPNPSTLYGSHPMLPVPGRVQMKGSERFKYKTEERPD